MDFMQSETRVNLARAFAGESQARNRYTIYADVARKEGQEYLARIFQETADNEKVHGEEFLEMIQKHAPTPPRRTSTLTPAIPSPWAIRPRTWPLPQPGNWRSFPPPTPPLPSWPSGRASRCGPAV